jgi:DnaK suppressor protein
MSPAAGSDSMSTDMNHERTAYFRSRLEQLYRETQQRLHTSTEERRLTEGVQAELEDRASSSYEKELSLHESSEERQILLNIRQALDRIREGTFGECLGCGSEINSKRLEAVPWTQYCIDCQRSLER